MNYLKQFKVFGICQINSSFRNSSVLSFPSLSKSWSTKFKPLSDKIENKIYLYLGLFNGMTIGVKFEFLQNLFAKFLQNRSTELHSSSFMILILFLITSQSFLMLLCFHLFVEPKTKYFFPLFSSICPIVLPMIRCKGITL